MIATLLLLLACGEDPTPYALCVEDGSAECCEDADCSGDAICHFSYTCYERDGALTCSEPIGDKQCHDLCTPDSGLGDCEDLGQVCQAIEHVQGGDQIESLDACF